MTYSVREGYFSIGLWVPLPKLRVDMIDYFQRAPNHFTSNFYLIMKILDIIASQEGYGKFWLAHLLSYFTVGKSSHEDQWISPNKRNKRKLYVLQNKTLYEKITFVEIDANYS